LSKDIPRDQVDRRIVQIVKDDKPKTVKELIDLVKKSFPLSDEEIQNRILHLEGKGEISIKPNQLPVDHRLNAYLLSGGAHWYWTVLIVTITTMIVIFSIPENLSPLVYLRYGFGIMFVLWLPGYTLIKALFPGKELESADRVALSLGMSLAIVPLAGLMLNYSPWGIRLVPIVFTLSGLTTIFATTAVIRENRLKQHVKTGSTL
jgi:hypothetical protein